MLQPLPSEWSVALSLLHVVAIQGCATLGTSTRAPLLSVLPSCAACGFGEFGTLAGTIDVSDPQLAVGGLCGFTHRHARSFSAAVTTITKDSQRVCDDHRVCDSDGVIRPTCVRRPACRYVPSRFSARCNVHASLFARSQNRTTTATAAAPAVEPVAACSRRQSACQCAGSAS